MRYSKEHKAATRERIVEAAARRFRRDGIDAVSVPALMKEIGLTHGGFYAHFASKDALVAEAIVAGQAQAGEHIDNRIDPGAAGQLRGFVDAYLSAAHRDAPESGCAIAALSGEVARQSPALRLEMTSQIEAAVSRLVAQARATPGLSREEVAIGTLAGVVGGLLLSRICRDDQGLSDSILSSSRKVLASISSSSVPDPTEAP